MKKTAFLKKTILFLTVLAALTLFTACSKSEPAPVDNSGSKVTQEAEAAKPTETTPAPTSTPTPEPTATPTPDPTATPTPEPTATPTPEPEPEPEPDDNDNYGVDALGNTSDVYDIDKSRMAANIIDAADYGPYYVVTLNFKAQYEVRYENLADKKVGDTLILEDKSTTITHILGPDEDYNFTVELDSYEEGSRIVVQPDFPDEFYTPEQLEDMNYDENPESACFAFVLWDDNWFRAYTDWAWFDCYVPMYETVLWHVNLVVTENTEVHPVYYSYADYPDDLTISGFDYLQLRDDHDLQEEKGIGVYDGVDLRITEVLDDTGRSTGEISRIDEIYMP